MVAAVAAHEAGSTEAEAASTAAAPWAKGKGKAAAAAMAAAAAAAAAVAAEGPVGWAPWPCKFEGAPADWDMRVCMAAGGSGAASALAGICPVM